MKAHRFLRIFLPFLLVPILQACNRWSISKPEIVGSEQFKDQVQQAMVLFQQRDLAAYEIVTNNVGRIEEGDRSGIRADETPTVYVMSDRTAFDSLTWCAATIAHDSFHSKLYHDYQKAHPGPVPDSIWAGRVAEQECMEHQLVVMHSIGASEEEISYARTQADGHYVTNAADWQEYKKRKW